MGAFIPGMPLFADEERVATAWKFAMEDLVISETPSTRLPVQQVNYVRANLAELPAEFFANPAAVGARMTEVLRISQNSLAALQGQVTGQPYLQLPVLPLGLDQRTAWDWGNKEHREFIKSQQGGQYRDVRDAMQGQMVFIPEAAAVAAYEKAGQSVPPLTEGPDGRVGLFITLGTLQNTAALQGV